MRPIASPSVSSFQLSVSLSVMACVMLKSCIAVTTSFFPVTLRGSFFFFLLGLLPFVTLCIMCLYSNATETVTFQWKLSELCFLLYKYTWTKFKSVSSVAAEAPWRNRQKNIKLTVYISFVVVVQCCFQWIALWVSTKNHRAVLWLKPLVHLSISENTYFKMKCSILSFIKWGPLVMRKKGKDYFLKANNSWHKPE